MGVCQTAQSNQQKKKDENINGKNQNKKNGKTHNKDRGARSSRLYNDTNLQKRININSELVVRERDVDEINFKGDEYKIIDKLGEGSFGEVYHVEQKKSHLERAMKKIKINKHSLIEKEQEILNEIELLKKLDHPNIVKLFEFYKDSEYYYLITEYCKKGELYDAIVDNCSLPEDVSANIMYQLFSALYYCHSTTHVIHRDLKPENIMISDYDKKTHFYSVKIIDFGTAKFHEKNKNENKVIGSSLYIAPEVLEKNYDEKCDIWSCGVILYILLCGTPPFTGHKDNEILQKVKLGHFDFNKKKFEKVSSEAKDLINKCLEKNKNHRISAMEALNHQWFEKFKTKQYFYDVNEFFLAKTLQNIRFYKPKNKLQEFALAYIVHNLPELDEIKLINKIFWRFNSSSSGKLTKSELKESLLKFFDNKRKSLEDIEEKVEEIFENIDNDNNGFIEFEEFARAGIDKSILKNEAVLRFTFGCVDTDGSGTITLDELAKAFHLDQESDQKTLKEIMTAIDEDKNGDISFEEYKRLMLRLVEI